MSNKFTDFISPRGTAKYPRLDQPYAWSDAQNRSVPDPDGQYEVKVLVPADEAKPLIATITKAVSESGMKPKHLPYRKAIDKETNEETGDIEFTFRAYGKTKQGGPNRIKFVDAKTNPMPSTFRLTSGSIIKISGYVSVAKMGARLNMRGVQVISLAQQSDGFSVEEGYQHESEEEENTTETTVAQLDSSSDEDDNPDF